MKYFQLILMIVTFSLTISCNTEQTKQVTNKQDYQAYLNLEDNTSLNIAKEDLEFWTEKVHITPNQYPYYSKMAAANSTIFKLTGDIEQLKKAEENLTLANTKTNFENSGYLRALAKNYISQHRFKQALGLLLKAEENGEHLNRTQFMLVDVYLELGELDKVEKYLSKLKNFKDFDYLIRLSKYNDHLGNLYKAILYLENALTIAESSNNQNLIQWNYTNLADYYGHAGRIKDSYNAYLKALAINPNNSYAKKGIAWIVYSYERNPKEALRILDAIAKENTSPDYFLLKSEIAGFMGNIVEKEKLEQKYLSSVSNENYGAMYAKYNVLLFADNADKKQQAFEVAKQEVMERPTAQSYDLLAWSYYKNGELQKALEITKEFVINKTFEPEALLHTAYILKANGEKSEAKKIKEELLGAIYELGPASENEIRNI
jgi:tetratricopeptide (TPR) repeat protein